MRHLTLFVTLLISVTLMLGCGEKNPYGTVKVEGRVSLDGEPAANVSVTFIPKAEDGQTAGGMTDTSGKFVLTTGGASYGGGAVPGEYDVTFYKIDPKTTDPSNPIYIVPKKYGDPATSGIASVSVEKGKKNRFEFVLKTE